MIQYDAHHWWKHFFDIRGSMLRQIVYRVLSCVLWTTLVVVLHFEFHELSFPADAHALVGVALGMLLVFRTNASYDRFWEGRKLWGGIVNETRNLARQSAEYLTNASAARVIRWTIAFPYACLHLLRKSKSKAIGEASARFSEAELAPILASQHAPLAVARQVSRELSAARRGGTIGEVLHVALDQNVQQLIDYIGACERILNTPLPFAYTVHLRRALILYCFTLPFALVDKFGWGAIPATFVVAYTLFGIEEIGVEIENPFGEDDNDLPLEEICAGIAATLDHVAGTLGPAGPDRADQQS